MLPSCILRIRPTRPPQPLQSLLPHESQLERTEQQLDTGAGAQHGSGAGAQHVLTGAGAQHVLTGAGAQHVSTGAGAQHAATGAHEDAPHAERPPKIFDRHPASATDEDTKATARPRLNSKDLFTTNSPKHKS